MEAFLAPLWDSSLLEFVGLVAGLLCVWLLIRQNVWTWPVGILYVLVSLVIFWRARLYADLGLHLVFLVLNGYGWWFWTRGARRAGLEDDGGAVLITRTPPRLLAAILVGALLAALGAGWLFARYTDADLPYWDNTTTMLSLAGMWLSSRKKIESWHVWFVVDVVATGIYTVKGLHFYAVLYLVYCAMAVAGWRAWRMTMDAQPVAPRTA